MLSKRIIKFYIATVCAVFISACGHMTAPSNIEIEESFILQKSLNPKFTLQKVKVSIASNEKRKGEITLYDADTSYVQLVKGQMYEYIEKYLNDANVISRNNISFESIDVYAEIVQYNQPLFSSSFPTLMTINYKVYDKNKNIIFDEDIDSFADCIGSNSILGIQRSYKSVENSTKLNAKKFVTDFIKELKLWYLYDDRRIKYNT